MNLQGISDPDLRREVLAMRDRWGDLVAQRYLNNCLNPPKHPFSPTEIIRDRCGSESWTSREFILAHLNSNDRTRTVSTIARLVRTGEMERRLRFGNKVEYKLNPNSRRRRKP